VSLNDNLSCLVLRPQKGEVMKTCKLNRFSIMTPDLWNDGGNTCLRGVCPEVRGLVRSSTMKMPNTLLLTIAGREYSLSTRTHPRSSGTIQLPRIDVGEEVILHGYDDDEPTKIVAFQVVREGYVAFRCVLHVMFSGENPFMNFRFEDEGEPPQSKGG